MIFDPCKLTINAYLQNEEFSNNNSATKFMSFYHPFVETFIFKLSNKE